MAILATKSNGLSIGVDIREDSLKLIALKKIRNGYKLMAHAFLSLKSKETIAHAFQYKLIGKAALRTSLHDSKMRIAQVTAPIPAAGDEVKSYQWSIAESLKIPIQEYVIRYDLLHTDETKHTALLMAFAVERNKIDEVVHILKEFGTQMPEIVEPDIHALANNTIYNYDLEPSSRYAIIDVSKSMTQLAIVSGEGILYYRQCSGVSGIDFMAQASIDLGVEESEVVDQIIAEDGSNNSKEIAMADSMSRYYSKLSIEIQYSIQRYLTQNPNTPVTNIIISGGGAHLSGLEKHIEEATHIPTALLDPFKKIDTTNFDTRELEHAGARYGIATGLAL